MTTMAMWLLTMPGTVTFSCEDFGNPNSYGFQPILPGDYQFTSGDAGTHTFSVTLFTANTDVNTWLMVFDTSQHN